MGLYELIATVVQCQLLPRSLPSHKGVYRAVTVDIRPCYGHHAPKMALLNSGDVMKTRLRPTKGYAQRIPGWCSEDLVRVISSLERWNGRWFPFHSLLARAGWQCDISIYVASPVLNSRCYTKLHIVVVVHLSSLRSMTYGTTFGSSLSALTQSYTRHASYLARRQLVQHDDSNGVPRTNA